MIKTLQSIRRWIDSAQMREKIWKKHPRLRGLYSDDYDHIHFISAEPRARGISWKYYGPFANEGWIYGRLDEESQFNGDGIAYVYPNFKVALLGKFEKEFMVEAREVRVTAFRYKYKNVS